MEVKFDVTIKVGHMYHFMLHHTYTSFSGVLGTVLGIALIFIGITGFGGGGSDQGLIYLLFGVLFLVYLPLSLYSKARRQVLSSPMFKEPLTYTFDDQGITTAQNESSMQVTWAELKKVKESKRSLIVYVTKVRAFILPKECIGDDYEPLTALMKKHMDVKKVKLKK